MVISAKEFRDYASDCMEWARQAEFRIRARYLLGNGSGGAASVDRRGLAVHGVNGRGRVMSDADQLRNRATRLLALALKARDNRLSEYADELTQSASEAFEQAAGLERRLVSSIQKLRYGSGTTARPGTVRFFVQHYFF